MTGETEKKRILFVDDEANILQGLKRMLRSQRHEWDMDFTESGEAALAKMEEKAFDIVVSDMRMPGLSGVQLLTKVKALYPNAVRFILSGHADKDMILQSIGVTHQFLAKPCDPEFLKSCVTRAFDLRNLLNNPELAKIVQDAESLPTLPELFQQLSEALGSAQSTSADIAAIISKDISMTAKILQLVNSAFFGLPRQIESIEQAVSLLGAETINSVVLTAGVFDKFDEQQVADYGVREIYSHSVAVGAYASKLAKGQGMDGKVAEAAMIAGMTHDLGKLVFISTGHEVWPEVYKRHKEEGIPLQQLERDTLGVTHAEAGAYLLGLWGLPDAIIEAVAFHHEPSRGHIKEFGILGALHIADACENRCRDATYPVEIDMDYVESIGAQTALQEMEAMCKAGDGDSE